MGAATSSSAQGGSREIFASARERAAFEKIIGPTPVPREDAAYSVVLTAPTPLAQLSATQVAYLNQEYGAALAQNNLRSGNFRVLVRYVIQSLPFGCRVERMSPEELDAHAPTVASSSPDSGVKKQSVEMHIQQAVNALFLVRNFTMRFVEKQDECSLLAHFNRAPPEEDWNTIISPRNNRKDNVSIRIGGNEASSSSRTDTHSKGLSDDLAFRFVDTLLTVLIDFPPTPKTYDLHVEVVNMLLVMLSPVAFPRDHRKSADDLSLHNPFLHMLMNNASAGQRKAYWASGIVHRLLQNFMEQMPSPLASKATAPVMIAAANAEDMSLVKISQVADLMKETEQFSYLTLEGIGSLASSIFKFPLTFYHYFVTSDVQSCPLADRSVFLLLVLLQSCRDSPDVSNPFRDVLSSAVNAGKSKENSNASTSSRNITNQEESSRQKLSDFSLPKLLASIGRKAPYESNHLLLYTLLYSATDDSAIAHCDVTQLMLPLLETLYHARSVEPSRIYMLVIVLLTYTQDANFVRDAHTKIMVNNVPWYSERYILDISLGSLMMVIFTRLIFRNITHFQDSFIHLNAFAGLSNLARYAENIHVYAAQSIVGLIEMLAKKEVKLVERMNQSIANTNESMDAIDEEDESEREVMLQKQSAYVEFIRLLLGIVSSCLKAKLLPRNPQLIYSLLYRAETFNALQEHQEFTYQVHNGPLWKTLNRFQSVVDSKTPPGEFLDVDTVLDIIRSECVSMLASTATSTGAALLHARQRGLADPSGNNSPRDDDEEASYRYEEEAEPEQFFIPYIWKLIYEQTPDFCWKVDKITLFVPAKPTIVTE